MPKDYGSHEIGRLPSAGECPEGIALREPALLEKPHMTADCWEHWVKDRAILKGLVLRISVGLIARGIAQLTDDMSALPCVDVGVVGSCVLVIIHRSWDPHSAEYSVERWYNVNTAEALASKLDALPLDCSSHETLRVAFGLEST